MYNNIEKLPDVKNLYKYNTLSYTVTEEKLLNLYKVSEINKMKNSLIGEINECLVLPDIKKLLNQFSSKMVKIDENFIKYTIELFRQYINFTKYRELGNNLIETIILIKLYELREDFTLKLSKKEEYIIESDKLNSFNIISEDDFVFLNTIEKNKTYTKFEISDILESKFKSEYVEFIIKYLGDYDLYSEFNFYADSESYDFTSLHDMPFNYVDVCPRYMYPQISNGCILPFIDHSYKYGRTNVNNFQQFEISTNVCHSAYYYRFARESHKIKLDFIYDVILMESLNLYLYEDPLIEDIEILKNIAIVFFKTQNIQVLEDSIKPLLNEISFEIFKDLIFKIFELTRLTTDSVESLSENSKILLDLFTNSFIYLDRIQKNYETYYDLDINDNPIYPYYKYENNKLKFTFSNDGTYNRTNFVVAKKIENIDIVNSYGIDFILNNDIDYTIEKGFYDVNSPYTIYLASTRNNFIKKGITCVDSITRYKYLKRFKVLYIPKYINDSGELYELDQNDFTIPEGRVISGLPVLAYSYLITPMNEKDRLLYFKKYF